ncbi:hypothetical protein T4D_8791 [Trichinella pseudospiralis]|uniref:Uncharacterized protein n=1 Tax=Trichinella pseudospiralis TaxID=6337 RepID=A0A0V1F699_TRIPS|nr:hypothetical protein T4D_8791 [Trichinella pseudospiralis]
MVRSYFKLKLCAEQHYCHITYVNHIDLNSFIIHRCCNYLRFSFPAQNRCIYALLIQILIFMKHQAKY